MVMNFQMRHIMIRIKTIINIAATIITLRGDKSSFNNPLDPSEDVDMLDIKSVDMVDIKSVDDMFERTLFGSKTTVK